MTVGRRLVPNTCPPIVSSYCRVRYIYTNRPTFLRVRKGKSLLQCSYDIDNHLHYLVGLFLSFLRPKGIFFPFVI